MANELSLSIGFNYTKGTSMASVAINKSNFVTVAGTAVEAGIQNIATTEEAVTLGDVSAPGYVFLLNTDATNYVEVGGSTGVYDIKLKAGQWAVFPLDGTTLFAKSNTAACDLQKCVLSA